jgi:hypothetical protein
MLFFKLFSIRKALYLFSALYFQSREITNHPSAAPSSKDAIDIEDDGFFLSKGCNTGRAESNKLAAAKNDKTCF